jgi:transposase, IS5 family
MRRTFNPQPELDVLPIERIVIPQSRDELPPVLAGLQWLWNQSELRTQIFALLTAKVMVGKKSTGRTGMELWRILVFGVVRLALDADWDRLEHIANHDRLVREILGLGALDRQTFHRRTLRDNVALLDAPLLLEINALIAKAGRELFSPKVKIEARVDSYVLETDVHFPTDFNLLWDAGRKCLDLIAHFQGGGTDQQSGQCWWRQKQGRTGEETDGGLFGNRPGTRRKGPEHARRNPCSMHPAYGSGPAGILEILPRDVGQTHRLIGPPGFKGGNHSEFREDLLAL